MRYVGVMKKLIGSQLPLKPVAAEYVQVSYLRKALLALVTVGAPLVAAILVTLNGQSLAWEIILWLIVSASAIANGISLAITGRQVRAMGYAELPEELAIRRGIMFQKMVLVPYGRLQQLNVQTGPLLSRYGLASLELVTASPETNALIPGLELAEAQRLREKITALGAAQMEGL